MRIDIVTVFPEMIEAALDHSIVKRARERGLVTCRVVNLRDFTTDRHRTTDDLPYGGGGGMVMTIGPISRALEALTGLETTELAAFVRRTKESEETAETRPPAADVEETAARAQASTMENFHSVPSFGSDAVDLSAASGILTGPRIVLTDPRGIRFTQQVARDWAQDAHLILLCGHYEGVDDRVRQHLVTDTISIGDYILTGGELPALVVVDALTRLQPGALGDEDAPDKDTFAENLLEYPHYTRPRVFAGWSVPDILLSGHHAQITHWRRWHQLRATQQARPDLFARLNLSPQDLKLLAGAEPQAPPDKKSAASSARIVDAEDADTLDRGRLVSGNEDEANPRIHKEEETDGTGTGNNS